MKAMIEVDIPAGRSISEAHAAVKRAFDEDWGMGSMGVRYKLIGEENAQMEGL